VTQRIARDRHLQPLESLRYPELGRRRQLFAVEEAKPERGIDRHFGVSAAEQPPHRLIQRLALQVPQRHVDGGQRVRGITGLPARHQCPVELVPDALMRQRIVAQDRRPRDAIDDLGDHILFGDGGEAVAGKPLIGLDLYQAAGERRPAIGADELDVQRDVERRRRDAGDLHGRPRVPTGRYAAVPPRFQPRAPSP
jgi:hypothetical protein